MAGIPPVSGAGKGPSNLPAPLPKREVLYSEKTPKDDLVSLGEAFEEAGYRMDALDFFVQARDETRLVAILEQALEEGDLFVYQKCSRALGRRPGEEEFRRVAQNARNRGLEAFARRADEAAGPREGEEE